MSGYSGLKFAERFAKSVTNKMDGFDNFWNAFVRNPDGSWFCRTTTHLVGPQGPLTVTPGVSYRKGRPIRGYDIAQWLDDWNEHRVAPVGVQFL